MTAGGLQVRSARPADLPQIEALLADRGEPADAVDLRLVVGDPDGGFEACAVVVDGDRVVSTATMLDECFELEGIRIPVGQVELVATDPAYEGRGLVRALMGWAHDRSSARGHLAQVMIGIPFFYRQFGYSYAIPMRRWRPLAHVPAAPADLVVRRATRDDIAAMHALQATAQEQVALRLPHSPGCWRWLVARDASEQWVVERAGIVVGVARTLAPTEGAALGELAAADLDAAAALVAHAAGRVDGPLDVQERPGTLAGDWLEPLLAPPAVKADWYYARIEHLASLLERIGPLLADRLVGAGLDGPPHDVLLSTWRAHVRFTIGPEGITGMTSGGPEQRPVAKGGSGLPPDAVPALLLGPHGALGLEEQLPDCYLGRQRELMAALFPPVDSDLLTYYLPL